MDMSVVNNLVTIHIQVAWLVVIAVLFVILTFLKKR